MKKKSSLIIATMAIMLLCFSLVSAEETKSTPSETKNKSGTSKKTKKAGKIRGIINAQGCLSQATEANCFTLTTAEGKVYTFQTPEAKKHDGHLVKMTGKASDAASPCSQGTFVTDVKIQHVSEKCPF